MMANNFINMFGLIVLVGLSINLWRFCYKWICFCLSFGREYSIMIFLFILYGYDVNNG